MATDKNTIKSWFEKDDKPTQSQFWAWIDSIWHKDEKIPITAIEDIENILNEKADAEALTNHLDDTNAHAELLAEPTARIAALEAKTDSDNNWKTITGYSLNPATRVLTMDAGWEGIINGIEYTNIAAQEMLPAIPLANSGYSRIDLIVFKTDGTFERISGVESTFTPVAPPKPAYTLEATFLTVGDGVVNVPVIPKPKAPVTSVNGMRGDVVLAAINDLVTGGIYDFLSAEQGKVLKTQIDNINILLASDNVNLDNVQELVDAIETVQTSLSTILVNDLTTGGTTKALTAEMGKTLKGLIDGLVVPTATDVVRGIVKTDVTVADPVVYLKETVDTLLKSKANYFLGIKPITGISYNVIMGATVEDGDILKQLVYDGTLPMNVIIPNNATVPFPIGTIFYTVGTNTGVLSVRGGSGVVFQTAVGLSGAQNEVRKYTKRGTNTWGIEGNLALGTNYAKTDVANVFSERQKFSKGVSLGTSDAFLIEEEVGTNPKVLNVKGYGSQGSPGWGSEIRHYLRDFLVWKYRTPGNNDYYFEIWAKLTLYVDSVFQSFTAVNITMSGFLNMNFLKITSLTNSPFRETIYRNDSGGQTGWHNRVIHRIVTNNQINIDAITIQEITESSGVNPSTEAKIIFKGSIKANYYDLSLLGLYTDDASASAGGVAVGFSYINSATGALQRRLI